MPFSTDLDTAELERLAILGEEMGEALQAIGKILRHGYNSRNPDVPDSETNRASLTREVGDVMLAIRMMTDAGDLRLPSIRARMKQKRKKMQPYLHFQ